MSSDRRIRAAVAGRESVQKQTMWQLQAGPLKFRCLKTPLGAVVQQNADGTWKPIKPDGDPTDNQPGAVLMRLAKNLAKLMDADERTS